MATFLIIFLFLLATITCTTGGHDSSSRIVGGKPVEPPHKYPWLVQMRVKGFEQERFLCVGVILDKRWIMTTKLCVSDILPQWATVEKILWVTALHNYKELDPSSQTLTSVEIVSHTGFRKISSTGADSWQHDIALVRVHPHIIFTSKVTPVNLPPCDFDIANDTQYVGTLPGWGWNETVGNGRDDTAAQPKSEFTPELNEVQLPMLTTRTCQRLLGFFSYRNKFNASMIITDDHICAGDVENGGKAPCVGDQGSPLMIFNETSKLWTMVGMASASFGCGVRRLPGTFVKISKYLGFITQNTQVCTPRIIP